MTDPSNSRPTAGDAGLGLDAGDILRIYFDRKRLIVAIVAAATLFTTLLTFVIPRTYVSSVELLVARNEPDVSDSDATRPLTALNRGEMLATEAQILTSSGLVARALEEHGDLDTAPTQVNLLSGALRYAALALRAVGLLDASDDPLAERIDNLAARIEVNDHVDANTLVVEYGHDSPDVAQAALSALIDTYLRFRIDTLRRPDLLARFEKRVAETRARMDELLEQLNRLRRESGMVDPEIERERAVSYLADLRERAKDLEIERHAQRARAAKLDSLIERSPPTIMIQNEKARNPDFTSVSRDVTNLESKRRNSLYLEDAAPHGWTESRLEQSREQLDETEELVIRYEVEGPDPQYAALLDTRNELAIDVALIDDRARLVGQAIEAEQIRVLDLSGYADAMARIEEELSAVAGTHRIHLAKREAAMLAEAAERSEVNVKVIKAPNRPARPAVPRLVPIVIAALAAFACALGLATLQALVSDRLRGERDVWETIGVPVLGAIEEV